MNKVLLKCKNCGHKIDYEYYCQGIILHETSELSACKKCYICGCIKPEITILKELKKL